MDERAIAAENLELIRKMMERGGRFTAISGLGIALSGVVGAAGVVATAFLIRSPTLPGILTLGPLSRFSLLITPSTPFLRRPMQEVIVVWSVVLLAALAINYIFIRRKARRLGYSLRFGVARRFYYAVFPALFAGAVFTFYFLHTRQLESIPGAWLICYGLAVISGSAVSLAALRLMGSCFLLLGAVTLLFVPAWGPVALGLGFGFTHIIFGIVIELTGKTALANTAP